MSLPVPLRKQAKRLGWYQAPPEGRQGRLRLDLNENTAGPPRAVLRAVARLAPEQISSYPEYLATERELARYLGVRPEEVLLCNGVDDALRAIDDGFAETGKPALLVQPTFTMYRYFLDLLGAHVVTLRYDRRLRFPMEAVLRTLRAMRPRLFFLANPNNPTGDLLGWRELRRILEAGRRTMVVIDEAYFEFSGVSVVGWIHRFRNLIVTRTFSKAAGLAGLRLGCLISNAEVIAALRPLRAPFSVNAAALAAASAVMAHPGPVRQYAREVTAARAELAAALAGLGVTVYPSAGNFLLADFGRRGPALLARLARRGILLRDRKSEFGREGWVRITVGTREQMRVLIGEMERVWTRGRS